MLSKTAVFLLAVALPAIQGFGLGGDSNMLSSKLGSLINGGGDNNKPITTTTTYTLPPPSTITISPVTPPTATYTGSPTSPIVYYTPTYVPTPFPVPIIANDEVSPAKGEMADAVDQNADGGRRRKRVQRVFPKRKRRLTKRKAARRNRRRG